MTAPSQDPKNGLLQTLASSGDRVIQLGILALVMVSGGGNFWKASTASDLAQLNHAEIHRAIDEIHRIDSLFDDAMKRQKEINDSVKDVLKELQAARQKQNP
jgi:hypothetical protein